VKVVSIETEIKIKIEDSEGFCRRLDVLRAGILSARHFEDNQLFDFPNQSLGVSQCLLRVRLAGDECYLTFKGPPVQGGIFKTREELETRIEDAAIVLQVLERIGMRVCFRYQKYRREFVLDGVHVAVDETPIGDYAEMEGSEEAIRGLAHKMGIEESQFLRFSYYALYLDHCQKKGVIPQYMVFQAMRSEIDDPESQR
jgi:adenylate cyclase, class 2